MLKNDQWNRPHDRYATSEPFLQHKCHYICYFKNKTLNLHTKHYLAIEMKIKSALGYSYRMIEILLILSITAGILSIGLNSHDNAEMGGILSPCIVAIVWMWFITLPLFVIYVVSFIRSIPPSSIYKLNLYTTLCFCLQIFSRHAPCLLFFSYHHPTRCLSQ